MGAGFFGGMSDLKDAQWHSRFEGKGRAIGSKRFRPKSAHCLPNRNLRFPFPPLYITRGPPRDIPFGVNLVGELDLETLHP